MSLDASSPTPPNDIPPMSPDCPGGIEGGRAELRMAEGEGPDKAGAWPGMVGG